MSILRFLIGGIIMSLSAGLFIGIISIGGLPKKNEWKKKIICCIVSIVIGFGINALLFFDANQSLKNWNNGYCIECGTKLRFTNAQHLHNGGDRYYYVCDNCGKIIYK